MKSSPYSDLLTTLINALLLIEGLLRGSNAQAMDFVEFLTFDLSAPSFQSQTDPSLKSQLGLTFGGGLSLAFRLTEHLELETSLLYLHRNFSKMEGAGLQTDYTVAALQYPILVRYGLSESFTVGMGGYYSTGVGNLTRTQNSQSHIVGYNDILLTSWELGLVTSAQYRWPLNENMSLISQARILLGLTDLDQSETSSLYTRDLQLWSGIGFEL